MDWHKTLCGQELTEVNPLKIELTLFVLRVNEFGVCVCLCFFYSGVSWTKSQTHRKTRINRKQQEASDSFTVATLVYLLLWYLFNPTWLNSISGMEMFVMCCLMQYLFSLFPFPCKSSKAFSPCCLASVASCMLQNCHKQITVRLCLECRKQ